MKFTIYSSGYGLFEDTDVLINTYQCLKLFNPKKEVVHRKYPSGSVVEYSFTTIEIESLEELISLMKNLKYKLIVGDEDMFIVGDEDMFNNPYIEIYDDYRE